MKIGMRHLHLFILLFAASSLLFQLPPEVFASTPSDITATDSDTEMDPEPEIEMDPEPEQTKKEKSKRQRR